MATQVGEQTRLAMAWSASIWLRGGTSSRRAGLARPGTERAGTPSDAESVSIHRPLGTGHDHLAAGLLHRRRRQDLHASTADRRHGVGQQGGRNARGGDPERSGHDRKRQETSLGVVDDRGKSPLCLTTTGGTQLATVARQVSRGIADDRRKERSWRRSESAFGTDAPATPRRSPPELAGPITPCCVMPGAGSARVAWPAAASWIAASAVAAAPCAPPDADNTRELLPSPPHRGTAVASPGGTCLPSGIDPERPNRARHERVAGEAGAAGRASVLARGNPLIVLCAVLRPRAPAKAGAF